MARLSHEYKLSARTAPEVVEGVDLLLTRLQRSPLRFRGRKLGIEALVGSVLLEFLEMPGDRQQDVLRRRLPQLEALLTDAAAQPGPAAGEVGNHHVDVRRTTIDPDELPGSARRKPGG